MIEQPGSADAPEEPALATDGEVDEDELARRRAAKPDSFEEPVPNADEQFEFELEEKGRAVTLSSLIARGTAIERSWKFDGTQVQGSGGLIPFSSPDILLVVDGRAGKVVVDPTYDADGRIEKVTLRSHVKARRVYDARTEAARARLGELPEPPVSA